MAGAVDKGKVEMKDAVRFLLALDAGENPRGFRLYICVLRGVLSQLFRGEPRPREFFAFLEEVVGKPSGHSIGAIMVAVEGVKDEKRLRVQATHAGYQGGPEGKFDMDDWSGTPLAVFASMLLDGSISEKGILALEACVGPGEFRKRMTKAMPLAEQAMKIEISELEEPWPRDRLRGRSTHKDRPSRSSTSSRIGGVMRRRQHLEGC